MIANLIGGFVAILIGVSLAGPLAVQVNTVTSSVNTTGGTCVQPTSADAISQNATAQANCQLYLASGWGASVAKMVPGFFALAILGIGIAVTYTSLRQSGII